jgi:hypothetical protein
MKSVWFAGALAFAAALVPAPVLADDPNDPTMRSAEARARDRAIIRRLNREQLAYVKRRDARYAAGWRAYRERGSRQAEYARDMAEYRKRRAAYNRDMAEWRHAVAACRAGRYEYCDR